MHPIILHLQSNNWLTIRNKHGVRVSKALCSQERLYKHPNRGPDFQKHLAAPGGLRELLGMQGFGKISLFMYNLSYRPDHKSCCWTPTESTGLNPKALTQSNSHWVPWEFACVGKEHHEPDYRLQGELQVLSPSPDLAAYNIDWYICF